MKLDRQRIKWWIFGGICILFGFYPFIYFVIDIEFGLLSTKTSELLNNLFWNIGFYGHIIFGGLALLVGWTQFIEKLRISRVEMHRTLGKVYVISVFISGISAVYIAFYATGGIISVLGFGLLGIFWLITTTVAFLSIRNSNVQQHENLMIYSFAACLAAVTLRIWLPILTSITGNFISAYQIVAWLCWIPNIIVAFILVRRKEYLNRAIEV